MVKRILWYGLTALLIVVLLFRNAMLNQPFETWDTLLLGVIVAGSLLSILIDMSVWLPFGKTVITAIVVIAFVVLMFETEAIPIEGFAIILFPAIVLVGTTVALNVLHIVLKLFRR